MTDTKNNNIKWNTTIRNVPDDVSYNTIYSRLNNYQNYSDEFYFKYDCYKISEYTIADQRLSKDVLELYDNLLEKNISPFIKNEICQSLGKIAQYCPNLKEEITNIGDKHHPLFECNIKNQNHLYTDEIIEMNSIIKERREERNKELTETIKKQLSPDIKENTSNQNTKITSKNLNANSDFSR